MSKSSDKYDTTLPIGFRTAREKAIYDSAPDLYTKKGKLRKPGRWADHDTSLEAQQARFLKYVDKTSSPKGCWLWTGSIRGDRGEMRMWMPDGSFERFAHRISFIWWKHPVPKRRRLCHTCDVKLCVNPYHMYVGTAQSNADDRKNAGGYDMPKVAATGKFGTHAYPDDAWTEVLKAWLLTNAKIKVADSLTELDVRVIRALYRRGRFSTKFLAQLYRRSIGAMHLLLKGRTFKQ